MSICHRVPRLFFSLATPAAALLSLGVSNAQEPSPEPATGLVKLAAHSWAYVAPDADSCNGALFVGDQEALVVDPGLTPRLAREFLRAARAASPVPIRHVVLTHWHPDHALGIACLEEESVELIAHPRTRARMAEQLARVRRRVAANFPEGERIELENAAIRLPDRAVADRLTLDLGNFEVELFHPGACHTEGDLALFAAADGVLVTGDECMSASSPSMGEGSVLDWINALDSMLAREPRHVVPGHFAPGGAEVLVEFRDYLAAVVQWARTKGAEDPETRATEQDFPAFASFQQFPRYGATFEGNAEAVRRELAAQPAQPGEANGFVLEERLDVGLAPHQIVFDESGSRQFVAVAGSDAIAVLDGNTHEQLTELAISGTPLGIALLPDGKTLAVTRFRGGGLSRLDRSSGVELGTLDGGAGASFLVPVGDGTWLVPVESEDRVLVLDGESFEITGEFPTGSRPFPPAVTSDGRLAFVPNYDGGTLTVIDLWNERVLGDVPVGKHPSGAAVLPGDIEVAVAVRGEDKIAFVNTASHLVTHTLQEGIGASPFSCVVSPDGRFLFVNNTADHDVSAVDLRTTRVVARVPTGEAPIAMGVDPEGTNLWVSCEGSHELDRISIPEAPARIALDSAPAKTQVFVMGMIHGGHRTSATWGLDQVRAAIRAIEPDVICCEIPPDRWERIWRDWSERGAIEDSRVKLFPEYTDVLLPLKVQMGFDVEPCAGWTAEMSDLRQARIAEFEQSPAFEGEREAYHAAEGEVEAHHAADPIDEEDPRVLHSERYDQRMAEELEPYDTYLNAWIGPGGWTHINEAHCALIDRAIARHPGKRILITFGAGHKYWIRAHLGDRDDVELGDINDYLE